MQTKSKLLGMLMGVAAVTAKAFRFDFLSAPPSQRTPSIPSRGRSNRMRSHAPNDGHWHMKYHRSR